MGDEETERRAFSWTFTIRQGQLVFLKRVFEF
jgi:hypothetical protein